MGIEAIASDYEGAAGSNSHFTVFDELWAFMINGRSGSGTRWCPRRYLPLSQRGSPRRTRALRASPRCSRRSTTAAETQKLGNGLFRAKLASLMAWHHRPVAPWQTTDWLEQMREQLRPNVYLRMIENRFCIERVSVRRGGVVGRWLGC